MCRRLLFFLSSKRKRMSFSLKKNFFLFFCHTRLGFSKETKRLLFFCPPLFLSKIKIASKVWNVQNFGERETRALCRHGSARERGTKGTSLSLSLSLSFSLERRKRNARCLNETLRAKSQSFPKFFFSLRTISLRVFSLFPRRRVQKLTCVLLPSLFLFESHRARPRKDGQSLGDSTVRGALVLYLLASDALVFSRARASGPTPPRDFGREREKGLKIFEFSPPLCVSLSQFFPNIE